MSRLCLHLLGAPRIEIDGRPIQVDTRKAIALLAYIAVTAESHRRDSLVNLLWPEYDRTRGRTALRRTLYALRNALARRWLDIDHETVGLESGMGIWVDVQQFRAHVAQCPAHGHPDTAVCAECLVPLTAAAELYRGDFLAGFSLRDSFNFDDWQFFQTDTFRREFANVLDRLVRCHIGQRDLVSATRYARRWLALDRLEEEAHRQLMRLYAWSGQVAAALRQFEQCVRILESQLGVSPQAATTELYEAIRANRFPGRPPPLPTDSPGSTGDLSASSAGRPVARGAEGVLASEAAVPAAAGTAAAALAAGDTPLGVEKRLVTVVCVNAACTIAAVADQGPEAQAALARRCLQLVGDVVERYGGRVDRALGGAVLATFGVSQTRETDAELAVRAALQIQQAAGDQGLAVAVGVNTGEAVVGAGHTGEPAAYAMMSASVEAASELARGATSGAVAVGEPTYRLTRRAFEFTPLEADNRGVRAAGRAYRVERLLPQARKARGLEGLRAELVGRDTEFATLREALAALRQGQGRMVSIIGEAGVGKSRLVEELRHAALHPEGDESVPLWLEGRCLGLGTAGSYAPFIDMLQAYFGWGAREAGRRRLERVTSSVDEMVVAGDLLEERAEEVARLVAGLLSLRAGAEWEETLAHSDPHQVRWWMFTALRDFFVALARRQPVVLVFEDLHWADSLSIDMISLLMEALESVRLLVLCVYRPEREHRCAHLATIAVRKCGERYVELRLRELTRDQSRRLVGSILGSEILPSSLDAFVLAECQGNPFFIEEMLRALIDAGVLNREAGSWHLRKDAGRTAVPDTVQSVIRERLDRLDEGCTRVLETAAVVGRVFPQRVLGRAIGQSQDLDRALWELEDRALIYQERTIPETEYSFKHVLTRETVYGGILAGRRVRLHGDVARAIETLYEDNLDEHCERLAYHWERSADAVRAIAYLLKAGDKARRGFANEEAIAHLTNGLMLLESLPRSEDRDRLELRLRLALGVPLVHSRGHAAQEVHELYARARALAGEVGEPSQLLEALFGLRRFHFARGDIKTAHDVGGRAVELAERTQDRSRIAFARMLYVESWYWMGEFSRSVEEAGHVLDSYDPSERRRRALHLGNDAEVGARLYMGVALWQLGYPDRALKTAGQALALAEELANPFTIAFALCFNAIVHRLCGRMALAQTLACRLARVSEQYGFKMYAALGAIQRALPCGDRGTDGAGADQLVEAIAAWRALEEDMWMTGWLAHLGEALARAGRTDAGLDALDEGLGLVESTGERCYEVELRRLKGELLLQKGARDAEAEACYRQALSIARRQGSKGWELRAATSLSRLWQEQSRADEARELLGSVYGWFSEGFDTADLHAAKSLLDSLT